MTESMPSTKQVIPDIVIEEDPRRAKYVDFFRIAFNPITVSFEFYQTGLINPEESPKCYFVNAICMSPQEAKLFSDNIQIALKTYEKTYGAIKIVQEKA